MLQREGATGGGDTALVGDENAVGKGLDALAAAGATDFLAVPIAADGDPEAIERTRAVLAARARR